LPEPFGKQKRLRAMEHAGRAGAIGVLLQMLDWIGGHE